MRKNISTSDQRKSNSTEALNKTLFEEDQKPQNVMDPIIQQLELSNSEDSVSADENDSDGSDENYGWRRCLKNVRRRDVKAADVVPSEPDGAAALVIASKIKGANERIFEELLSPE